MSHLVVDSFLNLGPFAMNSYLVRDPSSHGAILVDPGADSDLILNALRTTKSTLQLIFLTHGHLDHVLAVPEILAAYPVPLWLPRLDEELYLHLVDQCAMFGLPPTAPSTKGLNLYDDGWQMTLGSASGVARHTPGHTPGSSVLYFAETALLFGGDLLFQDSIGRTDLWGGDIHQMQSSLQRVVTLPPTTVVHPGHGPQTTIGRELQQNSFVQAALAQKLAEEAGQ